MPLITISRGIGCGGALIARQVADGLTITLFDDEKLQTEAGKLGYRPDEIKEMDEKAPGFFDLMLSHKPLVYLNLMESLIYEVAKIGDGVIIGHGSQMLLRDFECALHVHVYANETSRVQNLVKERGLSENAAAKLIHKSDQEQRGFFRFAFHMNWTDPSLYDLIINTEQLGIDAAVQLITMAAKSDRIASCSRTAVEAMGRLSLKKKIDAALLEVPVRPGWLIIEVPQQGIVHATGFAHSGEEREQIIQTIKSVRGVSEVEADIGISKPSRR